MTSNVTESIWRKLHNTIQCALWCIVGAFVLCPFTAAAHPHMFIDVMAKFIVTDTSLAGFWVYWDFDEMNSAMLIDEFDVNKNGKFESAESDKIKAEAFSYALQDNLFINLRWGTSRLEIRKADKFWATIEPGGLIRYSFFVPCNLKTEILFGKKLILFFEDPSMYIAFTIKKDMIQCSTAERVACSVAFGKQEYTTAVILTLSEVKN